MTKCRKKISNTRTTKRRGNTNAAQGRTNVSLFEPLENRQLMAVVNVADFGARANDGQDDRAAIQRAIDASQPGDTVSFGAGEFNSGGMLRFRGNRTYQGSSGATLKTSGSTWAATIEGNTSNVTVTGMKFVGAGIDMGGGSFYKNIKITRSEFSDMSGHAIVQRVRTDGLEITHNTFRNIRGYGVIETYNTDRLNYSYNRVIDSTHGGHILGPLQDCTFVGNYMTGLTDWMLEIQDSGSSVSRNMKIENNVAYDFRKGYGNTGGLSVVNHGDNTQIKNNYLRANFLPGAQFSEGHLHVAIEWNIESTNGVVSGNVVGSERTDQYTFVQGVGYLPLSGATMTNNKFYGNFNGGWGMGMPVQIPASGTNSWDRSYANMPAPPAWNGTAAPAPTPTPAPAPAPTPTPTPAPAPTPTPTPAPAPAPGINAPTNLRGTALTTSSIELLWNDNSTNEQGFKVERKTTRGGDGWTTVATLGANTSRFVDTGLSVNWEYDYRVVAFNATGSSTSGQVTVQTKRGIVAPNPQDPAPTPIPEPGEPLIRPNPVTVTGKALSTSSISLKWGDANKNETGYVIERKSTRGTDPWVNVATLDASKTSYIDSGLTRTWEYDYRVTVKTPIGDAVSKIIIVQTMIDPPTVGSTSAGNSTPVVGATKPVYVSDQTWHSVRNGLGVPEIDKTNGTAKSGDGTTMKFAGKTYSKGLGVHSNSKIQYMIGGKYKTFTSMIGLDDVVANKGSVVFQLYGDGKKLFDSGIMTGATAARQISVNVQGTQELWLVVNDASDGRAYDHANWADARLAA